ncbi:MAG: IPT/TIG domain-containing protein, partial [Blastocatellia bacterium]|nr:IPT/TIG domain-containing protein [Blastocatellia bacterium]
SPNSGTVGSAITIYGTGFSTASQVTFCGVAASFTINSDSQITAYVPNISVGTCSIVVYNSAGLSPAYGGFVVIPACSMNILPSTFLDKYVYIRGDGASVTGIVNSPNSLTQTYVSFSNSQCIYAYPSYLSSDQATWFVYDSGSCGYGTFAYATVYFVTSCGIVGTSTMQFYLYR